MRPALQRLLSRPSSLDLLRLIVDGPLCMNSTLPQYRSQSLRPRRTSAYSSTSKAKSSNKLSITPSDNSDARLEISNRKGGRPYTSCTRQQKHEAHGQLPSVRPEVQNNTFTKRGINEAEPIPKLSDLDLKSVVDELKKRQLNTSTARSFGNTVEQESTERLWSYVECGLHQDGSEAVRDIWEYIRSTGLHLPVQGPSAMSKGGLADNIWVPIVELGFKEPETLDGICQYANEMYDASGTRWLKLYFYVIQHMLLNHRGSDAVHWHDILSRRHRPGPATFQRLMRNVIISKEGDHKALKKIYIRNPYRSIYSKIVPVLLQNQEFDKAFDWHMFLQHHRDLPLNADIVQPLIQYFSIFDPKTAKGISSGLTASGNSLALGTTTEGGEDKSDSREDMLSIMSGEAPGSVVKGSQADLWVARWFATKWVTLDIAINTAHALKVESIGPLALQAIALREPVAADITSRIGQLEQRGIGVGQSTYSKALTSFAKRGQQGLLEALLESDQHPLSFDDRVLQEKLLTAYAKAGDWRQHQLILAVQLASAIDPVMEQYNMQLRNHATQRDQAAIVKVLETMRMNRIAVEIATIRFILRAILRPRTRGHGPDNSVPGYVEQDIGLAISILKNIMEYNRFVPITVWREVTRRLGMLGRMNDLHGLSLWLVDQYGPDNNGRTRILGTSPTLPTRQPQLSTGHPLHPLRLLFSDVRQRSIVEWGFIWGLMSYATSVGSSPGLIAATTAEEQKNLALEQMTQGIRFVKELQKRGVYIKESSVRRAVRVRLVILYGRKESVQQHNRKWRSYNPLSLEEVVKGAEVAWGNPLFPSVEAVRLMIENGGKQANPPPRARGPVTGIAGSSVNVDLDVRRRYDRQAV
ncbi:hypothetical protein VE01_02988 [Pseudogymnoascus verrucosus]|uniref:Pentatricopeptide repeat domain-containing protein n=1 Tax=Pseudogymnoascus verrucosus TaxID=342668 RepID=A0A1B8GUA3_9PEZI|nr:uncharacterized protein VE01_02988 [Pseudogymnoascus verrucosus]OBT99405.2 hypothetical protein VE01_02988 [Pseudogymnoascus verrucosus]